MAASTYQIVTEVLCVNAVADTKLVIHVTFRPESFRVFKQVLVVEDTPCNVNQGIDSKTAGSDEQLLMKIVQSFGIR